jgi:hypothetical protein
MEGKNRNVGSLVGGVLLIAFGALALAGQLFSGFDFWDAFWPFIVIGIGVMFFVVSGLAIPGSIISIIGLMLFVQNLTDHFESWAYGWTVILMAVGLGIFIMGAYGGQESQRQTGLRLIRIGFMLFVIFGAFFEMIFNSSPFAQILFPVALILVGGYLLVTRSGLLAGRKKDDLQPSAPSQPSNPEQ